MKFLIKLRKCISIITASCLLISFVIGPTAANAMTNEEATTKYKQIFKDFMLPYNYGQITSAHYAGTDRVIINIQDLHCHPKVQKNISNIIEIFDKSFEVKNVYLEGAYGQVSTSWIVSRINNPKRNEILEKMLDTGRLTGAEYYSAISGKTEIISGLEEKGPYLDNLKRFGDIVENQGKIDLILNAMDESLLKVKQQYYTKRQYKLEELSNNYRKGTITPQKYYTLLSKHIDKLGIDLSKYENTFTYMMLLEMQKNLDYSKVTTELQNLVFFLRENLPNAAYQMLADNTDNFSKIDKLYGYIVRISRELNLDLTVNFPNLDNYFGYIEFSQKINPLELIDEEKKLSEEINTKFSETKAQMEIVFLTNFGSYLRDYVSSKITADDYEYYKKNINTFRQLWNKYVDNKVLSLLDEYIAEADKFYKINTDRNIYFTRNMFKDNNELNRIETEVEVKGDVNKIIENMKGVKEVDVVITGGFHSQTVTEILKNHGVSYIVITPNVTEGTKLAEETYYEIAKEQSKISFQTLATLPFSAYPEKLRVRAAVSAFGVEIAKEIFSGNPDKIAEIDSIDTKTFTDEEKSIAQQMKILKRKIEESKFLESDDNDFVKFLEDISGEKIMPELAEYVDLEELRDALKNGDQVSSIKKILKNAEKDMNSNKSSRILRRSIRRIGIAFEKATNIFTDREAYIQKQELIRKINAVNLSFFDSKLLSDIREESREKFDEIKRRFEGKRLESLSLKDLEDYWNLKKELLTIFEPKDEDGVKSVLEEVFADIEVFISFIGNSAPKGDYANIALSFSAALADKINKRLGRSRLGIISSTTTDEGSIDAISTIVAQMYDALMVYVTAIDYLKYVNPQQYPGSKYYEDIRKLVGNIDKEDLIKNGTNLEDFLTAFKFVAENGDIYSKSVARANNTDSSNIAVIIGGGNVAIKDDLKNAMEEGNEVFLINSRTLAKQSQAPAIDHKKLNDLDSPYAVSNAVQYILNIVELLNKNAISIDKKGNIVVELQELEFTNEEKENISQLEEKKKRLFELRKINGKSKTNEMKQLEKEIDDIEKSLDQLKIFYYLLKEKILPNSEKYGDLTELTKYLLKKFWYTDEQGKEIKITTIKDLEKLKIHVFDMEDKHDENVDEEEVYKSAAEKVASEILAFLERISFFKKALTFSDKELENKIAGKVVSERIEREAFDLQYAIEKGYVVEDGKEEIERDGEKVKTTRTVYKLKDADSSKHYSKFILSKGVDGITDEFRTDIKDYAIDPMFVIYENGSIGFMTQQDFNNVYGEKKKENDKFNVIKDKTEVEVCFLEPRTIIQTKEGRVTVHSNEVVVRNGTSIYAMSIESFERIYPKDKAENKKFYEQYEEKIRKLEEAQESLSGKKAEISEKQVSQEQSVKQEDSSTKLTTRFSKFILKIRRLDENSIKGRNLINKLENWQILLGIFFPVVKNIFILKHSKKDRIGVEVGFNYIKREMEKAFETAFNMSVEEIYGLSFAKKLIAFITSLLNKEIIKELSDDHEYWNAIQELRKKGFIDEEELEIIQEFIKITTYNKYMSYEEALKQLPEKYKNKTDLKKLFYISRQYNKDLILNFLNDKSKDKDLNRIIQSFLDLSELRDVIKSQDVKEEANRVWEFDEEKLIARLTADEREEYEEFKKTKEYNNLITEYEEFKNFANDLLENGKFKLLSDIWTAARKANTNKAGKTYIDAEKQFNSFNGFILGLTSYKLNGRKYNFISAFRNSKFGLNLCGWFEGAHWLLRNKDKTPTQYNPEDYLPKVFENCEATGKKVYFFLPPNLFSYSKKQMKQEDESNKSEDKQLASIPAQGDAITREELKWIMAHPKYLPYIEFVVGAYDFLDVENEDIYNKYFSGNKLSETISTILDSPEQFIAETETQKRSPSQTQERKIVSKRPILKKEEIVSKLKNIGKNDNNEKTEIVQAAIDFINSNAKNKDKKEVFVLLKEPCCSYITDGYSKDQSSLVFNKIMELITEGKDSFLSKKEKINLLEEVSRWIDNFKIEQKDRDLLFDECYSFISENKNEVKMLIISNLLDNILLYSNDRKNKLVKFLLDDKILENDDENLSKVVSHIDCFDSKYRQSIFNLAINKNNIKINIKMLKNLIDNISLFDNEEQKNSLYKLAIESGEKSLLLELFQQCKYFNEQKNEIYNQIDKLDYESLSKDYIKDILETDEFENLDKKLQEKIIDIAINRLKFENIALLRSILARKEFFSIPQKDKLFEKLFNNVNGFITLTDMSEFKGDREHDFCVTVYDNIDCFSDNQQKEIENKLNSFEEDPISNKIENLSYSSLISKINRKIIGNIGINKYKLKILKNQSAQTNSTLTELFKNYKKLEAENSKALTLLGNLSSKSDLINVKKALTNMLEYYDKLAISKFEVKKLADLINSFFDQPDINLEKQKTNPHGYNIETIFKANFTDISINDLINVIHQTSINNFKERVFIINKDKSRESVFVQNFSEDGGYINPEINKLLSKIRTLNGVTTCFDEDSLVISIIAGERHSATIVVNTDNINRGVSFNIYKFDERRVVRLENLLKNSGFDVKRQGGFLSAKLDKNNGLSEDMDLTEKFDLLLKTFYFNFSDLHEGDDYIEKYALALDNGLKGKGFLPSLTTVVDDFYGSLTGKHKPFNIKENLDNILKELGLPEIPNDESLLYKDPQTGIEFVGQMGINKYFNEVLDRAFTEGRIIIEKGNLVKNDSYNNITNIKNLLDKVKVEQDEILTQATIIDELNKQKSQILKLKTLAKIGKLEYQTGYLQLSNGEYLFVKVLKNPINGMIRYANVESVSSNGYRVALTAETLAEKIYAEGYRLKSIKEEGDELKLDVRKKGKRERKTFSDELKFGEKAETANVSFLGKLMGGQKPSVVGRVVFDYEDVDKGNDFKDQSILFKNFLSPDDMEGTIKAKGIVLTSGAELSHQGLIVKEKGIPATILRDVNFSKDENGKTISAKIRYVVYGNSGEKLNGLEVEEIVEEREIIVKKGTCVEIDGKTGRLILLEEEEYNKKKEEYNRANESKDGQQIEQKTTIFDSYYKEYKSKEEEYKNKEEKLYLDYIKSFAEIEETIKEYFGTKSTNLQELANIISGIKNMGTVPDGVMIGYGIFFKIFQIINALDDLENFYKAISEGEKGQEDANKYAKNIINKLNNLNNLTQEQKKEIDKLRNLVNGKIVGNTKYAVRSAFIGEDGKKFSSAGVGESMVGVDGQDVFDNLINVVLKSMFSERSVAYQCSNGQAFLPSALVQEVVESKKSAVMLVKGNKIIISGSWGLGDMVVSGKGIQSTIEIEIDEKDLENWDDDKLLEYIRDHIVDYVTEKQDYGYGLNEEISSEDSTGELFSVEEIAKMVKNGLYLRKQYGYDADIELAFDKKDVLNILQIRPITEQTDTSEQEIEEKVSKQQQQTTQQKQQQSEEIEYKSIIELEKAGIYPIENIIKLSIGFTSQILSDQINFEGKIILVQKGKKIEIPEDSEDIANNITKVEYKIDKEENKTLIGGTIIGVINGKTIRAYKEGNNITFYSKQGLDDISDSQIESLFEEAFSSGLRSGAVKFGSVIAFAKSSDVSSADVKNRIANAAINGMQRAEVEVSLDLSDVENIGSIKNRCKGMSPTTIIINSNQLDKYGSEISELQKEGFRFILRGNFQVINEAFEGNIRLDGAILESADGNQLEQLENLAANNTDTKKMLHVETQMYVNISTAKVEIDINEIYNNNGIIPIIASDQVKSITGKYAIGYSETMTDEEINSMLASGGLVNILCTDNEGSKLENLRTRLANIFKNMFGTMNELLKPKSPEQRLSEETAAVSDYDFGENFESIENLKEIVVKDLGEGDIIKTILTEEITENNAEKLAKDFQNSKIYEDLPSVIKMRIQTEINEEKYFEAIGTIRGFVNQVIDQTILSQLEGVDRKNYFGKDYKEYRQYTRIIVIKLLMLDKNLKMDLNLDFNLDSLINLRPETNQSVKELFDAIKLNLNKDVKKTIIANKTAIKTIETKDEARNAITNLKNINALLEDSLLKVSTVKQLEIPVMAVKNILSAA